ncbi:TIR domain-containing protein [Microvirga massiliensis]|uniref:TIR domain-containing protein n=1 Tax=Microvirga massiliensis TaxID=1033741 RepID=UPI00062B33B1|nr:TIR domain-containing protein [Microvirga massiliensis]
MPDSSSPRIFLSYSRKDGGAFAARLRQDLVAQGFSLWQDLVTLRGGRDWWSQIEDALKSKTVEHFVLVVTPAALESSVVRREIRLARQEGKEVSPVRGPGLEDLNTLPRWLGHLYDLNIPEQKTRFVRVLEGPSQQKRVPAMAPEPPPDYVQRPREFEALKQQLLDSKGDAVAITAALKGAGGYGKTTLAKALSHDPDIQDAYFDGILWVELGGKPENLLAIISDLIEVLTGERPGLQTLNAASTKLGQALGDRRILMIVDDAWREQDLRPFLQGGPNTTRLVTTRIDRVLPGNAIRQPVDAMREKEALTLLASSLPETEVEAARYALNCLSTRLGEWALLLKIVNGFLRNRVGRNEPLNRAVQAANKRLDDKGLLAFDPRSELDRRNAVARTIGISLDLLTQEQRDHFSELSIFPEDADIPIGIIARLWQKTGGLDEFETEELLIELFGLSLLLNLDLALRTLRLHDVVRHFLRAQANQEGLAVQHRRLLSALSDIGKSESEDPADRRYYYQYLPNHLAEAGNREALDALLLDPTWMRDKLLATSNPQYLISDFRQYAHDRAQELTGRTLDLIANILAQDPTQLPVQFLGRLAPDDDSALAPMLADCEPLIKRPALVLRRPTLTPPGAELRRFEGHTNSVDLVVRIDEHRVLSGSGDNTLRLWDLNTGAELRRFEGHTGWVRIIVQIDEHRVLSGSADNTLRLWDLDSGTELRLFEGHTDDVTALLRIDEHRALSGSADKTLRLWDLDSGTELRRLEGHTSFVTALLRIDEHRVLSGSGDDLLRPGSRDCTLRLWDLDSGTELRRLEGYVGWVTALLRIDEHRMLSVSQDNTLRLWDLNTGAELRRFEGHMGWVRTIVQIDEHRVLSSGSEDKTLRLWDLDTGVELTRFHGDAEFLAVEVLDPQHLLAFDRGGRLHVFNIRG